MNEEIGLNTNDQDTQEWLEYIAFEQITDDLVGNKTLSANDVKLVLVPSKSKNNKKKK